MRWSSWASSSELTLDGWDWYPFEGGFSPRIWFRVSDKIDSSNEKIPCSPFFLLKKYEPSRPMNSPSVTGCALMLVSLDFHVVRRSFALEWFQTQATNAFLLVEGTPTCGADISTAFQQYPVVDRSGKRLVVQTADLRRHGVVFCTKRWA